MTSRMGTLTQLKYGRADRHLGPRHRFREEREDRAHEDGEAEGHEQHVVHQEHRLARQERVELRALAEPVPAPDEEPERRQQDRGQVGEEEGADAPLANAWTDEITPLRVRKVPKIVRAKVSVIRVMFQIFSIGRRSWTMTEWTNAVPMSQGMNEAFSTGSHAQ